MAAVSSDQSIKTSESLLISSVSKRSVLVVGDGNFSFSLSLAVFFLERGLNSTPLVVTSFDSHEKLKQDNFASSNLNELERFKNVDVLYQVDATNLCQYFPNQKFGRIIFNFPHTGGKSNIKKCRKLLEDFFSSAAQCLDHEGDICVTLCKGQGGTPVDQPCRSHGNSWQIVTNAAKSGLILYQLYPFLDSDYPYYKSVGYRSRLTKGFHSSGGLIHIFIPGVKVDRAEDMSDRTADVILANIYEQVILMKTQALSVCNEPDHPLHLLKQEIQDNLSSLADQLHISFKEIDDTEDCKNSTHRIDGNESIDASCKRFMQNTTIRNQKMLSALNNHTSFVLCDATLTIPKEITQSSHIFKNELIIGRLFNNTEECDSSKVDAELQVFLENLKALSCVSYDCEQGHTLQSSVDNVIDKTDSEIPTWTNSSQVAHLARPKCRLKSETNVGECLTSRRSQVPCNCQTLYQRFLKDARLDFQQLTFSELVLRETLQIFKISSTVIMVAGRLNPDILEKLGINNNRPGWLIKVDLGALAMERYQISDLRLLWSSYVKMEQQDIITRKGNDKMIGMPQFISKPLSLFPPSYIHDISFWISDDVSQEIFILAAITLTKDCVKDIKLIDVYHDENKHWLSFNYRMIYSRPDGPLSHLETVEFQNKLRRAMMVLKFGLK